MKRYSFCFILVLPHWCIIFPLTKSTNKNITIICITSKSHNDKNMTSKNCRLITILQPQLRMSIFLPMSEWYDFLYTLLVTKAAHSVVKTSGNQLSSVFALQLHLKSPSFVNFSYQFSNLTDQISKYSRYTRKEKINYNHKYPRYLYKCPDNHKFQTE